MRLVVVRRRWNFDELVDNPGEITTKSEIDKEEEVKWNEEILSKKATDY